jgi:cardiolipin synthase
VLSIALLPVVGVPLYYLVGERRIRRHIRAKISAVGSIESSLENRVKPKDLPSAVAESCGSVLAKAGSPPPVTGNRVSIINRGDEAYNAVLGLIEEARDHIHAQFFILDVDPVGKRFLHALTSRVKAGRKLLITDGATGFCGGMNIGKKYMGPRQEEYQWRDLGVVIRGPAVRDLQVVFLDDWAFATDETRVAGHLFPSLTLPTGKSSQDGALQVVTSGPDRALRPIYQGVFTAFTSARRRIWISTPYFVPDDAIGTALENAALRGIDVRLIVPEKSDLRMVGLAGRSYFHDMMQAGVKIHLYRPTNIHTKSLIIDDDVGVVGSSNVDIRSFFLNFELGVFLLPDLLPAVLTGPPVMPSPGLSRSLFLAAGAEKRGENGCALLPEDSGDHHRPVVEPLVGGDPEEAVDRSRLGIGRPEDDFGNPGGNGGPCAHRAGLEGHHETAPCKPVVGEFLCRLAQREDLGVSRGVVSQDLAVVRPGDDLAGGPDHDRADRNLSLFRSLLRLEEGGPHPPLPVSHGEIRGNRSSVPEEAPRTGSDSPPSARRGRACCRRAISSTVRPVLPREGFSSPPCPAATRGAARGGAFASAGKTS